VRLTCDSQGCAANPATVTKCVTILKFPEAAIRRRRLTDEEQGIFPWREKGPSRRRGGRDCMGLVTTDYTAIETRP